MFEIHVTVATSDTEKFKTDCAALGCKPIVIEVQNQKCEYLQVMTSQKYTHTDYMEELRRTKNGLMDLGYNIIRLKVEAHPDYLRIFGDVPVKYFESHIRVKTDFENVEKLKILAIANRWHLSRNIFKSIDNGLFWQMLTYRIADSDKDTFFSQVVEFQKKLIQNFFESDKIEVEVCIFDTNEELDKKWLG